MLKEVKRARVENLLALSTGHITQEVAASFDAGVHYGVSDVLNFEYGYLVNRHAIEAQRDELLRKAETGVEIPACLLDIAALAVVNDCSWILLDCDIKPCDEVPSYDW